MRSVAGRWIVWALALATSAGGFWLSWDLTVNHAKIPGQVKAKPASQPATASLLSQLCGSLPAFDCDDAAESPWAAYPFGSPRPWIRTSALGLAFFMAMICWLIMVGWPSSSRAWVQMLPLMATSFGAGLSIYLEYVMWTKLPHACPLCLGAHVATALLFVFMVLLWPRQAAASPAPVERPEPQRRDALFSAAATPAPAVVMHTWPTGWTLGVTAVLTLAAAYGVVWFGDGVTLAKLSRAAGGSTGSGPEATVKKSDYDAMAQFFDKKLQRFVGSAMHGQLAWQLAPLVDIPIQGRPAKGPANPRHTMVIFSDFECPACKKFEDRFEAEILPMIESPASGGVRIIFKHFPLNKPCNPYATRDLHPLACQAAFAAEAAFVVGGDAAFWRMHDLLFQNQEDWKQSRDFAKYAKSIGLDVKAFTEAMNSERVKSAIKMDIEQGNSIGLDLVKSGRLKPEDREWIMVNSTPTVYLDGKFFGSSYYPGAWRRILGVSDVAPGRVGPIIGPVAPSAGRVGPVIGPRLPAATAPGW